MAKKATLQLVLVSAPAKTARKLAEQLVRERLAACASLLPGARSVFWWSGKLDRATETLLLLKTTRRLRARLMQRIKALHPYEVPEILCFDVNAAYGPYAEWVEAETKKTKGN